MTTIAFVNVNDSQGTTSPRNITLSTTKNNELVVGITSDVVVTSITDTVGTVYSQKKQISMGAPVFGGNIELWTGIAAGTNAVNVISVAFKSGGMRMVAVATQYSGVAAEGNIVTFTGITQSNGFFGPTFIVQDANNWMVGAFGFYTPSNNLLQAAQLGGGTLFPENANGGINQPNSVLGTIADAVVGSSLKTTQAGPLPPFNVNWTTYGGAIVLELKTVLPQPNQPASSSTRGAPNLNTPRI